MPGDPKLPTPDDDPEPAAEEAELVAYLDGELDGEQARAVELKLSLDPAARAKAEALRKTYDLLEYLPRPEPSPDFTQRTVTRIDQPAASPTELPARPVSSSTPVPSSAGAPPRHPAGWLNIAVWAACGLLAGAGGYAARAVFRPGHGGAADLAFSDVRVIENLPLYVGVDDLDFLKRLDDAELFPDDGEEGDRNPKAGPQEPGTSAHREELTALFRTYPAARQQQLRQLDRQLHELEQPTRERLSGVLERYAVWCDRLSDADRKEVLSAPSPGERVESVKRVRVRTWRAALPAGEQARLDAARDAQELAREVTALKQEDAARRAGWELARRQWDKLRHQGRPWPFSDETLRTPVEDYAKALGGRLGIGETAVLNLARDRVTRAADGDVSGLDWLYYGATLYDLSHRHPDIPAFPNGKRLTRVSDLPAGFMREMQHAARVNGARLGFPIMPARWPDFAEAVVKEARELKVSVSFPVGPAKPSEFAPPLERFITQELKGSLRPGEWDSLVRLEGKWPEYPKKMITLARDHDLAVPGVTLPGSPRMWEQYYAPLERGKPAGR